MAKYIFKESPQYDYIYFVLANPQNLSNCAVSSLTTVHVSY
jgi:hypothetical protein